MKTYFEIDKGLSIRDELTRESVIKFHGEGFLPITAKTVLEFPVGTEYTDRLTGFVYVRNGDTGVGMVDWHTSHPTMMGEPNGFANRDQVTLTFDELTRTLTLVGNYEIWSGGISYYKTGDSIQISDVEGVHFIYYDPSGVLVTTTSFDLDIIYKHCYVASGYWDATNKKAIPNMLAETHGCEMATEVHGYLHRTIGTAYTSGLDLTLVATGNGSVDSHAQFTSTAGYIADEDIPHTILGRSTLLDTIPVMWRDGALGYWRMDDTRSFPFSNAGTGRVAFNQYSAGVWSVVEASNNNYVLSHVYAIPGTNYTSGGLCAVMGQKQYTTVKDARLEAASLILDSIPTQEFTLVATLIIHTADALTNSVNARFVQTETSDDYIDWRKSKPVPSSITGSSSGTGTVTSVSVTTANGVSGSVATATTTPDITLTLGAITPTSVSAVGSVTGSNLSGTNTGDDKTAVTGILKGNGLVVSAASAGVDYLTPNSGITGATKTKITYDADGLVTAGADATTTDIAEGTNLYYTDTRVKTALSAGGSAPIYACRAWVNYDQLNDVIRGSGNVSSVTDNGSGDFTVNFITSMPDLNYSVTTGFTRDSTYLYNYGHTLQPATGSSYNVAYVRMLTEYYSLAYVDFEWNHVVIHR